MVGVPSLEIRTEPSLSSFPPRELRNRSVGQGGATVGPRWTRTIRYVVDQLLARARFVRGTPFDPFGYAHVRRVERELVRQYADLLIRLAAELTLDNYDAAVAIADAAELVRGYEQIKLANVERYTTRLAELGVALD